MLSNSLQKFVMMIKQLLKSDSNVFFPIVYHFILDFFDNAILNVLGLFFFTNLFFMQIC